MIPTGTIIEDIMRAYGWAEDNPRRGILLAKHSDAERQKMTDRLGRTRQTK